MTRIERIYLEKTLENHRLIKKQSNSIPWKAMFTSRPVLACLYVSFSFNVLMTLIHSYQPSFFKEVLYLKMIDNGIYSAFPHIFQMSTKMIWSVGIDVLKQRKIVSNTMGCRISQLVGEYFKLDITISASNNKSEYLLACTIGGITLILIALFADCTQPRIALFMFIILGGGIGPSTSGFYTSIVTLAPAYTGKCL
jgi:hypothetical protein